MIQKKEDINTEEFNINKRNQRNEKKERKRRKRKRKKEKKLAKLAKLTPKQIKRRKRIKIYIFALLIIFIISLGIYIGIEAHNWKTLAKDMSIIENSTVKDYQGDTIATIGYEKINKQISYEQIPTNLKNAYIAIEDERFYSHGGIDVKRTGAAIASYIFNFGSSSYGGSTITQQLVKNLTGDSSETIWRKISEWWKACQLETCFTKDEILATYLNIIYVGPNVYGIETGANYYFDKSCTDLTLAESAYLAGINNSPNSYNPFGNVNNDEKIEKRTKTVLNKMKELNYISENDYNIAIQEVEGGLDFEKGNLSVDDEVYSYHTDALIPEIVSDISKKYNISETFASNYIEKAGLTIYSTQDSDIQKETEKEFNKSKYILQSKNGQDTSQAAMVIIDHKTGQVQACVGGLGKKKESKTFNRATQSVRQTGSAIKPIAVLAPAIDKKIITASTIFDDTEQDFENNYHPVDYSPSLGEITVRRAVESSQNIPFVQIMEKLTPKTSIDYMKKMGITTLTEADNSLPLALGGLQKGMIPLEIASAYATIANDGEYIEPTFYKKIERKNGEVLVEPHQEKRRVFSKEVAYILKDLLTQPVLGTNGTATYCKIEGVDVAAKTGTTDDDYDRWLCGFTPYYTAVTWFGYDKNETVEFNRRNPAGLIWANVMSRIHEGLNSATFEKPSTVTSIYVCAETGKKATVNCKDYYIENFLWFTEPDLCDKHTGDELKIDTDGKKTIDGIIKGISTDIDSEEPQKNEPAKNEIHSNNESKNESINNTNINENTNTNSYVNTNTNTNINNNTSINSNLSTNTNTNSSINTNTSINNTNIVEENTLTNNTTNSNKNEANE